MKKKLFFIFVLIAIQFNAQNNWVSGNFISNSQYYLDDNKTGDFGENDRFRSNNYLKLDANLNRFSLEIQVESYAPQSLLNFSSNFDKEIGFATYYANYKSDKLDATIGYFYEQFGNGLVLRSYEDKQLGVNNALRGSKLVYTPVNYVQITGLYGKHRVGFNVSDGDILGFDTEFNLTDALKVEKSYVNLGFSIVSRSQEIENSEKGFQKNTIAYSGRINYSKNNFYSSVEYVLKEKDAIVEFGFVNTQKLAKGNAFLLNTGYSKKGFSIDVTFRRLENMSFYSDRNVEGNLDNEQLVNYLPSLTKQHYYSLANIYIYQTQSRLTFTPFKKAGEIGSQIDVFYNVKKGTFLGGKYGTQLALNYATWYGLDAEFDTENRTFNAGFTNFGVKYFTEFNIEVLKKWSKKWYSNFTFINLYYNKKYIEETSGKVDATIAITEVTYKFTPKKSVRMEVQHLWTDDDKKDWVAGTLEMNFSSKVSLFAADLYNYGNELKKIHYYNFGGSFTKNSTRVSLSYGRQRGGLLCVGGICRIVPESTGFGLSINTSF
ncbi:MAG: hypothetical protein JKY16_04755 [Lutibacter sp.]|nr:hypothetical protein [Lutibacter sp.]